MERMLTEISVQIRSIRVFRVLLITSPLEQSQENGNTVRTDGTDNH